MYDTIRDNFPKYVVTMDEIDRAVMALNIEIIRDFLTADEWKLIMILLLKNFFVEIILTVLYIQINKNLKK